MSDVRFWLSIFAHNSLRHNITLKEHTLQILSAIYVMTRAV